MPDLIGFNGTSSYGSPSYYAQVMLAHNHGTNVVPDTAIGAAGLQVLVTRTGSTYYLTAVNTLGTAKPATFNLTGATTVSSAAIATVLTGTSGSATNSISNPTNIVPTTFVVSGLDTSFDYTFPANSITILKFSTLPGDYNFNGTVDAADYTVWRDTLGSTTDLRANGDNTGASAGVTDQADYDIWKAHFGETVPAPGAGSGAAAPALNAIVNQASESIIPLTTDEIAVRTELKPAAAQLASFAVFNTLSGCQDSVFWTKGQLHRSLVTEPIGNDLLLLAVDRVGRASQQNASEADNSREDNQRKIDEQETQSLIDTPLALVLAEW